LSEAVVTTLILTIGSIIASVLTFLGVRLNQVVRHSKSAADDSATVKEQVQNSHTTNLREESDVRHDAVILILEGIQGKQAEQARSLEDVKASQRGLKRDIGRLADADLEHAKDAREERARLSSHIEKSMAGAPGSKE
jgi:hypothetical protein